jgi:hypothetical protein
MIIQPHLKVTYNLVKLIAMKNIFPLAKRDELKITAHIRYKI